MFDQLDGVGPARRRALLAHFGSPERILSASAEELEGVSPEEALELGMQAKAVEFRTSGAEVYRAPADA